jgi:hypothetical protein
MQLSVHVRTENIMKSSPHKYRHQHLYPQANKATARHCFSRDLQLPQLLGLWPSELQDYSLAGTERIVGLLRKAIRAERLRGRSGHWSYDLNRHISLAEALKCEEARLGDLRKAQCGARTLAVSKERTVLCPPAAGAARGA